MEVKQLGVVEYPVYVDTVMLEEYLSNAIEPDKVLEYYNSLEEYEKVNLLLEIADEYFETSTIKGTITIFEDGNY